MTPRTRVSVGEILIWIALSPVIALVLYATAVQIVEYVAMVVIGGVFLLPVMMAALLVLGGIIALVHLLVRGIHRLFSGPPSPPTQS